MNKLTKQRAPFTQVPNALLADPDLSLKAKGLYALMYSKSDGWQFYESALVRESRDGKDAVGSGLDELVEAGWLVRSGGRSDDTGRFTAYDYELRVNRAYVVHQSGKPVAENPLREIRDGKPATNNTDLNNTDGIIPPVSPKPTKASSRANPSQRLSEYLAASGGIPPVEWGEWAHVTFGWDADRISFEWDDFSDYWNSGNAKGGGRKSDWAATWRSHCRRQSSDSRRGYRAGGKARNAFATALASSVANRYGVPSAGSSVGGGNAAEGAGANPRPRADRLPNGEIPF